MPDEDENELEAGGFRFRREQMLRADIDPAAQDIITSARATEGEFSTPDLKVAGGVVEVMAQLREPESEVKGLRVMQRVGDIVTATVAVEDFEAVQVDPNVVRLEVARRLYRMLDRSVFEIRANREQIREQLPEAAVPFDGQGVIVGVVDHGCDFVHQNFRVVPDGADFAETRILFLWDQHGQPPEEPPAGHPPRGREFDSRAINLALMEETKSETAPYDFLHYMPERNAHGTSVLDVAAGNGRATCARGVAPRAEIIFVDPATDDPRSTESLGNSQLLADAVKYIFDKADGKPAVVNISLNARDGPHDGSTLVEKWIDRLLETPGRAVVIAAGNWRDRLGHAAGKLERQRGRTLKWLIREGDETDNELEIWYDSDSAIRMSLLSPDEALSVSAPFGYVTRIYSGHEEVGRITHGNSYTDNGAKRIAVFLSGTRAPAGGWSVVLESGGARPVAFHAWIAGDPGGQSVFDEEDADPLSTLGAISCGRSSIVVGSYNPLKPHSPAPDTSSGPTRDGKKKPEVSAPGVRIRTARARAGNTIASSGTSLAAPHVAGSIALMLQAAGEMLPVERLRDTVSERARRPPPEGEGWNPVYGNGRVDALASALALMRE